MVELADAGERLDVAGRAHSRQQGVQRQREAIQPVAHAGDAPAARRSAAELHHIARQQLCQVAALGLDGFPHFFRRGISCPSAGAGG